MLSLLTVALTVLVALAWMGPATGAWLPQTATSAGQPTGLATISLAESIHTHATVRASAAHASRRAVVRLTTAAARSASPGTPARVARKGGLDWKQIARNERTPARAGQRQPRMQQLPLLFAVLLLILLGLLAAGLERLLPPRLAAAANIAVGLFCRAPPLRTA